MATEALAQTDAGAPDTGPPTAMPIINDYERHIVPLYGAPGPRRGCGCETVGATHELETGFGTIAVAAAILSRRKKRDRD